MPEQTTPALAGLDANAWARARDELDGVVVAGTTRRRLPGAAPDAEATVLDGLALLTAARRAGRHTVPAGAALAPAGPETMPQVPDRATHLLQVALTQSGSATSRTVQVGIWARECRRRGYRLAPESLPAVLELVRAQPGLREDVIAVVGARGRWLAAANPAWAGLLREGDDDAALDDLPPTWATLPIGQRAHLLRRLHGTHPDLGRTRVRETLADASANDRVELVKALGAHLGEDDGPLLDSLLDDRAASVRRAAADLLDRLPGSARATRNAERVRSQVRLAAPTAPGRLGRRRDALAGTPPRAPELDIDLTPAGDADWVRDGIGQRERRGRSERGGRVVDLVAGTPLRVWSEISGLDPRAFVETIDALVPPGGIGDPADLLDGLQYAVVAQRDQEWALALLDGDSRRWRAPVAAVLAAPAAEAAVLRRMAIAPADRRTEPLIGYLADTSGPLGPEISRRLVDELTGGPVRALPSAVVAGGAHLDPQVLPDLAALLDTLPQTDPRRRGIAELLQHATFRQTISEALT